MDPSQRAALRMVIDDLARERDNLSVTIATLKARLALDNAEEAAFMQPALIPDDRPPRLRDEAVVSPGELANMTSKDGVAHVLRKAGRPLTTQDLLRLLRRGGKELPGLHAVNTLRRALDKDPRFYYARPRHWAVREDSPAQEVRPSG